MTPKLIATSSLDGLIKLWDLSDKTCISELRDLNQDFRGVKGLTYSGEFGKSLLSYGF